MSTERQTATGAPVPRSRISGLDGIRGLAALYVVANHDFERAFPGYPAHHAPVWAGWFIYGRFAVVVFIVLSGFSLALAPARRGWCLGGVREFARRRARRILPAYWAALAFSLAVAWLIVPQNGQGPPTTGSVLVNGFLVQNIVGAPSPNRAFWSMAVEAQLYLFFGLLIWWLRRFGPAAMLAIVGVVVAAVGIAGPHIPRVDTFVVQSAPDLAWLFAIGIVGAGIVSASPARRSWPWQRLALIALAPALALMAWQGAGWTIGHYYWVDLTLGPAVACLLAGLATGRPAWLRRLLDTRPMRTLGRGSYSLYLTHLPILTVVYDRIVVGHVAQGVPAFLVSLAIVVPLSVAFSQLFARLFEAPFLRSRGSSGSGRTMPAVTVRAA